MDSANCFYSFACLDDGQCVTENREWLDPSKTDFLKIKLQWKFLPTPLYGNLCLCEKSIFSRFLSPNCRLLCNSLVLMSFYQVHYANSSSQNARTGQICCLFSTSKVLKAFSFRGRLCSQWRRQGGASRGTCPGCKTLCPGSWATVTLTIII